MQVGLYFNLHCYKTKLVNNRNACHTMHFAIHQDLVELKMILLN